MLALGCESTVIDPAMFTFKRNGVVVGLAGVHVDDVLFCGEADFHDKVIDLLIRDYVVGRVETENFTFTGWSLTQNDTGIELTQRHFLNQVNLEKYQVFARDGSSEQLDEDGQGLFRSIIGSIQWLTQISRPDKAYQGVALATKLGKASKEDARSAYRTLKDMMENPETIKFPVLKGGLSITTYTDSSWGKLAGYETVNGSLTFVQDSKGSAAIIDWQSVKMATPAASPLAGEAEAALSGLSRIEWIRSLASDMGFPSMEAVLITDSKSLCETVRTTTVTKDKRAMVAIANLRRVDSLRVEVLWDSAKYQLADNLTKNTSQTRSEELRTALSRGKLETRGESEPARMTKAATTERDKSRSESGRGESQ